jgi:hypothetical protein
VLAVVRADDPFHPRSRVTAHDRLGDKAMTRAGTLAVLRWKLAGAAHGCAIGEQEVCDGPAK